MLTRRQFAVSAVASGAIFLQSRPASAGSAGMSRRIELAAFRQFAEQTHPRGAEAAADRGWRSRWQNLERDAANMSDGSYFIALRRAFGWFGDGHTTPLPFIATGGVPDALRLGPFGRSLPIRIEVFHDAAIVTAASDPYRALLGAAVEKIGDMPVSQLIREHCREFPGNRAWAHRWAGFSLSYPADLQGLAAISDALAPVPVVIAGRALELPSLPGPVELIDFRRSPSLVESWSREAGRGNHVRPVRDQNALFISIDNMADEDGATFEQFTREAFAAMDYDWPERIIIDLRRNGGGNNFFGEALRKRIAASRFNRPGGLYLLVGPQTFSAAQNLATRLERETFALFVGEPTGGAPNHYGDSERFVGPATGLTAMVSTLPWFDSYPHDDRQWILPDLPVPATSRNWKTGDDPALELALTHRTDAVGDQLRRDSIFYFRRPSQNRAWRPFWSV